MRSGRHAAREALRRPECNDNVFSLAAGDSGDWEDEFKKLVGEVGRFTTAEAVPADWVDRLRPICSRLARCSPTLPSLTSRQAGACSMQDFEWHTAAANGRAHTLSGVRRGVCGQGRGGGACERRL